MRFSPLGPVLAAALVVFLPPQSSAREVAANEIKAGQADASEAINARMNAMLKEAFCGALKRGDRSKALAEIFQAMNYPLTKQSISNVERQLEADSAVRGLINFGTLKKDEQELNGAWAGSVRIKLSEADDACVGIDKFGHFIEEGFILYQVSLAAKSDTIAAGFGRWLEGLRPDDETVAWIYKTKKLDLWWTDPAKKQEYDLVAVFGCHAADPRVKKEQSSPADTEANNAGMRFWRAMAKRIEDAPKEKIAEYYDRDRFDIRDWASDSWDERPDRNPNVAKLAERPAPPVK